MKYNDTCGTENFRYLMSNLGKFSILYFVFVTFAQRNENFKIRVHAQNDFFSVSNNKSRVNKLPNVIMKYADTCDTENFRYLMSNLGNF